MSTKAKISTMGSFQPTEVVEAPIVEEVKTEITPIEETVEVPPNVVIDEKGKIEDALDKEKEVEKKEVVVEDNSSTFNIDLDSTDKKTNTEQPSNVEIQDWKTVLKSVDKKELFKELGINDFALEIDEHIKNGGNPSDYLLAKAVDWTKVSHKELVLESLKEQYPNLSDDKIVKLFDKRYSQSEFAEEDDKELGSIQLEADAENIRAKKILEQKKFKVPESISTQIEEQLNARIQQMQEQKQNETLKAFEYFNNHETTKALLESKRVASKYGENGVFNFNIDKPELLMKVITDGDIWGRVTSTKEGEPNVGLLQEIALFALNPLKFKTDLVNHGKSLGAKGLIEEGKNAIKEGNNTPTNAHNEKPTYKLGVGGR